MSYRNLLLFFLFLLSVHGFSQSGVSPLQALLRQKENVWVNWQAKAFAIADTPLNTFPQNLLKTKDGLYLFVNGSGRVYQLQQDSAGIKPQRIDSTIFFGYNFSSFPFVYHDTMYSLGGYGMWRINGQLRAYIPQAHSWDIVPLNEEVPVLMQDNDHNMLWYDEKAGKLYVAYSLQRNQAVKKNSLNETTFDYTVRSLDMQTKEWKVEGALSDAFTGKVDLIKNIAFTSWGQLVTFGNKLLLIDYEHNKILHLSDEKENKIRPVLFQYPTDSLYYCADSVLYFGNILEHRLQSLVLHRNDFVVSGDAVYAPEKPVVTITIALVALSVLLLAVWILWKRKSEKVKVDSKSIAQEDKNEKTDCLPAEIMVEAPEFIHVKPDVDFNEKEMRIIQLISINSRKNFGTSTDEINRVLGLLKTNADNQKSQRSKLFTSINKKYSNLKHTNEELIQKSSLQHDGRSKEYYIAIDLLDELETMLSGGVQSF